MTHRFRQVAFTLLIVLMTATVPPAGAFDREQALSDYAKLKNHLSEAYANLEWMVDHRGLDLQALDAGTTAALHEAASAAASRKTIEKFVRAFRDPHLYAKPLQAVGSKTDSAAGPGLHSKMSAKKACRQLGFNSRNLGFRLEFEDQPGYRALTSDDANPFPAGLLELDSGRTAAFIRIAHFGEDGYPQVCRELFEAHAADIEEMCDDGWCGAFHFKVRDRLLAYLEQRIVQAKAAGYDLLVIDITANGGGTDWVHAAARIVSPSELTCGKASFVKHPHWTTITASKLGDVDFDLKRDDLSARTRQTLERVRANLQELHDQTRAPCDRSSLWEDAEADLGCSNIVEGETSMCGLLSTLDPEAISGVSHPALYFKALENEHTPHVNDRPLALLIDGGTASASELFGSVLQDSRAAVLVGSRSYGAGCGFVNGGIPLRLEHLGLTVMAPDCVRFRVDGMNEIEGMAPDIELDWSQDSAEARTRKVLAALASLPAPD